MDVLTGAAVFALFGAAAAAVAANETWWRRVCMEGTEVIILRGRYLIHRGTAYGRVREWRRPHLEGAVESVLRPEVLAQAYGTGVDVVQDPATGQPRIHR